MAFSAFGCAWVAASEKNSCGSFALSSLLVRADVSSRLARAVLMFKATSFSTLSNVFEVSDENNAN